GWRRTSPPRSTLPATGGARRAARPGPAPAPAMRSWSRQARIRRSSRRGPRRRSRRLTRSRAPAAIDVAAPLAEGPRPALPGALRERHDRVETGLVADHAGDVAPAGEVLGQDHVAGAHACLG